MISVCKNREIEWADNDNGMSDDNEMTRRKREIEWADNDNGMQKREIEWLDIDNLNTRDAKANGNCV